MSTSLPSFSGTQERAMKLLGAGISADQVASALGVTPSYISQLLATESFSSLVSEARYNNLQKHNARDSALDSLEDKLIEKMDRSLPLMTKPESIMRALQIVNAAKRRGASAPNSIVNSQNIVNIILPQKITQKFTTNVHNQVISAGTQNLLTIQSASLLEQKDMLKGSPPCSFPLAEKDSEDPENSIDISDI